MSQILQRLIADRQQARITHKHDTAGFLGVLIGDIQQKHNDKNPATDQDVIARIKVQMKNAKEFYDVLKNKTDSTPAEAIKMGDLYFEYATLNEYLPVQLTEDDIRSIIITNAFTDIPLGDVQKWFKANYAGRYDGKTVSQVMKSYG